MNLIQHVNIKCYLENNLENISENFNLSKVIPVFHNWIKNKVLDEVWIDVANYEQVPAGPGVVIVAHDAIYSLEYGSEEKLGLLYNKRTISKKATNKEIIKEAIQKLFEAKDLLEKEKDIKLKFSLNEFKFFINDRILAPNNSKTFESLENDISNSFKEVCGENYKLSYKNEDKRELFQVLLTK